MAGSRINGAAIPLIGATPNMDAVEFHHHPYNTFNSATMIAQGMDGRRVDIYGGPSKLDWAALQIAASNVTLSAEAAVERAVDVLKAVEKKTQALIAEARAARNAPQ